MKIEIKDVGMILGYVRYILRPRLYDAAFFRGETENPALPAQFISE